MAKDELSQNAIKDVLNNLKTLDLISGHIQGLSFSFSNTFTVKQGGGSVLSSNTSPAAGSGATLATLNITPVSSSSQLLISVGVTAQQTGVGSVNIAIGIKELISGNTWVTGTIFPSGQNDTVSGLFSLLFPTLTNSPLQLALTVMPSAAVGVTYLGNKSFISALEFSTSG